MMSNSFVIESLSPSARAMKDLLDFDLCIQGVDASLT